MCSSNHFTRLLFLNGCDSVAFCALGWDVYDFMAESKRMFALVDKKLHWKLTLLNMDYGICGSYPPRHYVPPYYDDLALKQVAAFRDGNRFPAFSWIHPFTNASLVRCSQPLPGRLGGKRCPEDEQLIAQIFKCNPDSPEFGGYVLDARPYSSAMANRAMGAGFERSEHYGGVRVEFLGIENIHTVSDSLVRLKRAVRMTLPGPLGPQGILGSGVNGMDLNQWMERLHDSGWLKHIQTVLNGAVLAATLMHAKKTSVIVHCTHGWDRTAQLTSLPMLMLDPYYRSYSGFQVLIEKEWVAYGHKFLDRCNHTASTQYAKEQSPIFLQFLDCVHQLLLQFPTHFEFNEKFLIDLLDIVYSCQYGTFLTNNHQQHVKLETHRKTVSAWSYFNHSTIKPAYVNPLYDANEARKEHITFLRPSTAGNKMQFWDSLFNRSDNDPNIDSILQGKYAELKQSYDKQAAELNKLREELAALRGEAPVSVASSSSASSSSSNLNTSTSMQKAESSTSPSSSSSLTVASPSPLMASSPTPPSPIPTHGDSTDIVLGVVERSITSPSPSSSPVPTDITEDPLSAAAAVVSSSSSTAPSDPILL